MRQKPMKIKENFCSGKKRSKSVSETQQQRKQPKINSYQGKGDHEKAIIRNHAVQAGMLSLRHNCLVVKKQFLLVGCTLSVFYQFLSTQNEANQGLKQQNKTQKIILTLEQFNVTIIKNQIKHCHKIREQPHPKHLLIDLKRKNQIKRIYIEKNNCHKKIQVDVNRLPQDSHTLAEDQYHSINPLQFIQQGIRLRALRMQSTGSKKKIAWGLSSSERGLCKQDITVSHFIISSGDQKKQIYQNQSFSAYSTEHKSRKSITNQNSHNCSKKIDFGEYGSNLKKQQIKISKPVFTDQRDKCILKQNNKQIKSLKQKEQNKCKVQNILKSSNKILDNFLDQNSLKNIKIIKSISFKSDLYKYSKNITLTKSKQVQIKNKQNDEYSKKRKNINKQIDQRDKLTLQNELHSSKTKKSIRAKTQTTQCSKADDHLFN